MLYNLTDIPDVIIIHKTVSMHVKFKVQIYNSPFYVISF